MALFRCIRMLAAVALLGSVISRHASGSDLPQLSDSGCRLVWQHGADGWRLSEVTVHSASGELAVGHASGRYTLLYAEQAPSPLPEAIIPWYGSKADIIPVALNLAGEADTFYPEKFEKSADGSLTFTHDDGDAHVRAVWKTDPKFPGDVCVTLTLTAKKAGWFSMATPTLTTIDPGDLKWAVLPGYFQGSKIEPDLHLAFAYGQGLPNRPIVARERTASTLSSVATTQSGASVAVIADPGVAADPWENNHDTRAIWRLGLSHMNRQGALAPTLYHPVLGQDGSHLESGQTVSFGFRYTLRAADWFEVEKHAIYDIYHFADFLALKQARHSLTDRIFGLRRYAEEDKTSRWKTEEYKGAEIGAQVYAGWVKGDAGDALKNSDYGAMWMLAQLTGDRLLIEDRLPEALHFKLAQQQTKPGFFQGAVVGQYYLWKSHRFVEEAGGYVEPIAITYYTLIDLGNILLFDPHQDELRDRLRLGADKLLEWQRPDGSWAVAYNRKTEKPTFTDLTDFRPTFYGLLVAYRILGDQKYLDAAKRGADWLVREGINQGKFLGVCGDTRFPPDFATGQIAQGMLDLYDVTHDDKYRQAAIAAARFYTTAIYTHPIASTAPKMAGGQQRQDWEINQSGLSFEHGGAIGSANVEGPILLASHAGLFIRMYALTGEPLFRDMARAAVLGRDAFVNPSTSVASYYYRAMNSGAGEFPQHAWWQIGWITDYLISEAALRLHDRFTFPRGFFTPKVGPHAAYGFAAGQVEGEPAALILKDGLIRVDSPNFDYLTAQSTGDRHLFVVILNDQAAAATVSVSVDSSMIVPGESAPWKSVQAFDATGIASSLPTLAGPWKLSLGGFGAAVLKLSY